MNKTVLAGSLTGALFLLASGGDVQSQFKFSGLDFDCYSISIGVLKGFAYSFSIMTKAFQIEATSLDQRAPPPVIRTNTQHKTL